MPKVRSSKTCKATKYVSEFPGEHLQSDGQILYCAASEKSIAIEQRFQVTQHLQTNNHKENKNRKLKFKQNFLSSTSSSVSNTFNSDLCQAFIKTDIPLAKLQNFNLKSFLEKYTAQSIPDESTLRKNYIQPIYKETLVSIRNSISDGPIWVSIDETTDVDGRFIANIIIGKLNDSKSQPFLLSCQQLDKCNHQTIARFFNNSMSILWPDTVMHENVLLFVSDAVTYMIKASKALNAFFPKIIHLTCLAHAFHRIVETIRSKFTKVDELISSVKKIFLKAPNRVETFKIYTQI